MTEGEVRPAGGARCGGFVRTPYVSGVIAALLGTTDALPSQVARAYPELASVRWRRGGLPPRLGGWCLGAATVSGIALGRTVWLAPGTPWDPELLLHEARHVQQWAAGWTFPLRYILESLTRGYWANRFEVDARDFAAQRLAGADHAGSPLAQDS